MGDSDAWMVITRIRFSSPRGGPSKTFHIARTFSCAASRSRSRTPARTAPPRDLVRGDAQSAIRLIRDDAVRTSLQIGWKGAIALRSACAAATQSPWPFLARRFYLARADAKIAYIGPLALADPLFGFRLGSLQSRWALAVLLGRPPGANRHEVRCKRMSAGRWRRPISPQGKLQS